MSRFAKDVDPQNPFPEYPRPQMTRTNWLNLNGIWQYQPGQEGDPVPSGPLSGKILVPFPVESALSGVMEHHDRIWYKRTFIVPKEWKNNHVLLHFGAVDYESEVFVNGRSMGIHRGGYDPFSYDITGALKSSGPQELVVRVFDPTDSAGFPRGKQTLNPHGIMYTSSTGIWQTVWVEPVPINHIADIRITPDIDRSLVQLKVTTPATGNCTISVKVSAEGRVVQSFTGKAGETLLVPLKNVQLWSPDAPFLYDMSITLLKDGRKEDSVSSYFGMRKISVGEEGGYKKLFLNNKFVFQLGPLDQGFWPDGLYTPPTEAAMKYDLEVIKKLGFNMVRKHIKVEPYRWYYWADKMGLLVWQDMPSANSYTPKAPAIDTAAYAAELKRMVETHWNSPSIITWVVFNESQGQHNTGELVKMVKEMDPSRLVNQGSGGGYYDTGDYLDIHSYPPPAVPIKSGTQVLANGEYGGIGYVIPDHTFKTAPTYIMIDNEKAYTDLYDEYANDLTYFKTQKGLSAAVYTEITDVEGELNGFLTYDRTVLKGGENTLRASNLKVINGKATLTEILPSSEQKAREWKYTFDKPTEDWFTSTFNDSDWKSGVAGFGSKPKPKRLVPVNTPWETDDIWVRQSFILNNPPVTNLANLVLYMHHDDDCEVYINGVKAAAANDTNTGYVIIPMTKEGREAIKLNGKNVIAIHCHQKNQKRGGQFIDAGISEFKLLSKNQ